MTRDDTLTDRITTFLTQVGIPTAPEPIQGDTFLPAMVIRDGTLVYDPARLEWPGDLLHEAGHIATHTAEARETLSDVPEDDGGMEMAAICWSWAAATEIGLDPAILFHDHGYRGGGPWLRETFGSGNFIGLNMLQWFGMAFDEKNAPIQGVAPFPAMQRWLR